MTSRISNIAKKSVVIIADRDDENEYCSGCVVMKQNQTVMIIASSDFVDGREDNLTVVFFDGVELNATVIDVEDELCLLTTEFHQDCQEIRLMDDEDNLVPDTMFIFAPLSQTARQRLTSFCTSESLDSYRLQMNFEPRSDNYFLASCSYVERNLSGIERLIAAPIFTSHGRTAGVVLRSLRDEDEPEAAEIRIILKASHIYRMFFKVATVESSDDSGEED